MSRNQPYRHKMTPAIATMIGVASRITLYLLGQNGPTSFMFKDRLDNKYKVSIGGRIQCSCQPTKNDHCLHSIYVMTRLFNIPTDNPLVWQASYLDSELSDIVAGKYSQARRRMPMLESLLLQETPEEQYRDTFVQRPQCERMKLVEGESACPICQEDMTEDMLLTHCKVKCGNNFHHNCVKIWVEHKVATQAPVTCPMCRCDWGRRVLETLTLEEAEYKRNRFKAELESKAMEFACKGCGTPKILGCVYKCVLCEDNCLCEGCFLSNKHMKHPFILGEAGEWRGAPERREREKKVADYIAKKRKETYTEQLIAKFTRINEDPTKLLDYLASSYPYVSKYISDNLDPYKKLDFQQDDMKCMVCGSSRMITMRRLNCGHFIDHDCLKQCIDRGKFYCMVDGSQFLKGYESLLKRKANMELEMAQRTKFSSEKGRSTMLYPSENQMYNFSVPDEQEQNLHDILGSVLEAARLNEQQGAERLRRRLNSNIVRQPHSDIIREEPSSIRIRNVPPSNKRTPGGPGRPTNLPPRPPTTRRENNHRAASLNRRLPQTDERPRLSIEGVVARRLAQQH